MPGDYATRGDLDHLRDQLNRDLRDTERLLRDRDDDKERQLRAEFIQAVQDSERRTHDRLSDIDAHLTAQDAYLMRRRLIWPNWRRDLAALTLSTVVAGLVLHFGFHVPIP